MARGAPRETSPHEELRHGSQSDCGQVPRATAIGCHQHDPTGTSCSKPQRPQNQSGGQAQPTGSSHSVYLLFQSSFEFSALVTSRHPITQFPVMLKLILTFFFNLLFGFSLLSGSRLMQIWRILCIWGKVRVTCPFLVHEYLIN